MTEEQPKKKRSSKLPVEVTEEELNGILEYTPSFHHKLAMAYSWLCGLRISESLKLQPKDFDIENKRIYILGGKGDKDRVVPLPIDFQETHLKYFPIGCSKRALQKAFETAVKNCGLKEKKPTVHFHSLRHGFATHCLRKEVKLTNIQLALGHNDLSTTSVYLRVTPDEMIDDITSKCS